MSSEPRPRADAEPIGEDRVEGAIGLRSYRLPDGIRIEYDDTGTFDITCSGARITWYPAPGASEDTARIDLVRGIFWMALHLGGVVCLHGSGVAIGDAAVGFLAPQGYGKSTTAAALSAAGADFITDDTLAVEVGAASMVWPGPQSVRLLDDSARRVRGIKSSAGSAPRAKHTVRDPEDRMVRGRVPLAALYELAPLSAHAVVASAVRRARLSAIPATLTLLRHSKVGTLLGGSEAPGLLARAGALAAAVPVYRLEIVRDFDRLAEVTAQLLEWHGCGPTALPTNARR